MRAQRLGLCLVYAVKFTELAEKVEEILTTLYEMVTDGFIEVQDTNVVKVARRERKAEAKLPHEKKCGKAKLLRVYLGEADRWHDQPLSKSQEDGLD